jgi:hypothetical protein
VIKSSRVHSLVLVTLAAAAFAGCNWSGDVIVRSGERDMSFVATDDMNFMSAPDLGPGCGLNTCSTMKATCGPVGDGCGGMLDCGSCTKPQTCGGGGTPFVCGGQAGCIPLTCAQLGLACGPAGDGCGGSLDCGSCTGGKTCGGGGTPGVCGMFTGGGMGGGCVPKTCAVLGYKCGMTGDGCGNTIDCGNCPTGQICGAGGPGKCGKTQ